MTKDKLDLLRSTQRSLQLAKSDVDPRTDERIFSALAIAEDQVNFVIGILARRITPDTRQHVFEELQPLEVDSSNWCEGCQNSKDSCTCPPEH